MADIRTETFTYSEGGATLEGRIAYDAAKPGKRPGVLVVHEWWGHNEHARNQAVRLANTLKSAGITASLYGGRETSHNKINADLGKPGDPGTVALFTFVDKALGK